MTHLERVKLEALQLPSGEREELAEALFRSLEDDTEAGVEEAVREEVIRRYRAIRDGRTQLISAEEVFAELRAEPD